MPAADLHRALAPARRAPGRDPGVGKKTAERLVVELQDRVRKLGGGGAGRRRASRRDRAEAVSALVNLGYRQPEAERAVRAVSGGGERGARRVIRRALQKLSG